MRRGKLGDIRIKKILLMKFWGLGNLAVIYPLIGRIKEKYPEASIFFVTFDLNKGFLEKNQAINEIIYIRFSKNILRIVSEFIRVLQAVKRERIDAIVNFETFNNISGFLCYLSGAPVRIGLNNKYEKIFYTYSPDNDYLAHISQNFLNLLKPLKVNSSYEYFYFQGSKSDGRKVEDLLKCYGMSKFICIHPGTSKNFTGKRWKKDNYSALSNMLIARYDMPVVFTGTEKDLVKAIIDELPMRDKVLDLSGRLNIWGFVELLKKSFLFVSSDTGPVHIAAALKINAAVFYGPTTPEQYRPLNKNSLIFYRRLKCSPCIGVSHINKRCKNDFRCLDFSVQEAFSEISERFFNGQK